MRIPYGEIKKICLTYQRNLQRRTYFEAASPFL